MLIRAFCLWQIVFDLVVIVGAIKVISIALSWG